MSNLLVKELKRSKYRLLGLVGQGQFGRVYCASHRKTGHLLALKELDKQRFPTHKFLRELRFLLSLRHPNIVSFHALEHTRTGRYLVMDYCEGGTLRGLMEKDMRLQPDQALRLVIDVLAGLEQAHNRGIVHCDIKPENILLTLTKGGWTARVSDFGISRLSQELSKEGSGKTGSPAYMAPERFYGQYSLSSDLYAVGVLLFELLAGFRPFSGTPADLMTAHLNQPVKIPEFIPNSIKIIILTALQKLPARRFYSATEMLSAVRDAVHQFDQGDRVQAATTPLQAKTIETIDLPPCTLTGVYREQLLAPIQQLLGTTGSTSSDEVPQLQHRHSLMQKTQDESKLFRVFGDCIGYQPYTFASAAVSDRAAQSEIPFEDLADSPLAIVPLPEAIREVVIRPQGCFAVTQKAVYLIPADTLKTAAELQEQSLTDRHLIQPSAPQVIAELGRHSLAAIEARGRWMVTATSRAVTSIHRLNLYNLVATLPQFQTTHTRFSGIDTRSIAQPVEHLFQLYTLDSRHFVAITHAVDKTTSACITGVNFEVFNRRGGLTGVIHSPLSLRQVIPSSKPYQLVATEPEHANSLLLLDLKPYRMQRIGIEITPDLLAAASWGFVLMEMSGRILLINQYGEQFGQIDGPVHPTAISVIEPYTLLIATWDDGQGSLYAINLQRLDLDMLF